MRYENIKNIELLISLLKKHNIRKFVISPGGTNIQIVKRLQNDDFFECFSVVDERSAAYVAIGMYLQTREVIGLVCTSAQATRNYVPGLTEAFYKHVPLLAITMEKHPRFKYQGYMQAPDQTSLPHDSVKKSFEVPFLRDINDYYHSKRVINEAILELNHNGLGPVQLCIPWLDFKIDEVESSNETIERIDLHNLSKINLNNKKVLLVIGEHLPFTSEEMEIFNRFCEKNNVVVYTNHLSNVSNKYTIDGNLLISTLNAKEFNELLPDIVLSIGGQTGDYPLYLKLSKTNYSFEHWMINESGNIVDMFDKLTKVIQMSEIDFFSKVASNNSNHDYYDLWKNKVEKLNTNIEVPLSNAYVASKLSGVIPKNSVVQFSILNSLRVWNLFKLDPSIECYSNVGAFGIDGGMSTMLGQSIVTDKKTFMVIGDLAFLYDINSLSIRHIKNNARIILINNNGGVEFKLNGEDVTETNKFIAAAGHFKTAKGWAENCGFKYLCAKNKNEFDTHINELISDSQMPIIIEVFVNDLDEKKAYQNIINSNKEISEVEMITSKAKGFIKSIINKK